MKTITIIVKDLTSGTLTNVDGLNLRVAIDSVLASGDSVLLSFNGIHTISSSFLNSSLGEIVDKNGFDVLKSRIKITNYTTPLAGAITKYVNDLKASQVS
jgi:hypothetical protein